MTKTETSFPGLSTRGGRGQGIGASQDLAEDHSGGPACPRAPVLVTACPLHRRHRSLNCGS